MEDNPARFVGKGRLVFKSPGRDAGGAGVLTGQLPGGGHRGIKDR